MAPKKPRRNNKKKKGKAHAQDSAEPENIRDDEVANAELAATDPVHNSPAAPEENQATSAGGGLYGIYKRSTQRFKDGLAALVPKRFFELDRVQALVDAVDFIVDQQRKIDAELLEDCRVSLQFRKSYSKNFDGGGDEGHEYFILVLNYCYQTLRQLVPQVKQRSVKENAKRFRFTDFEIDSDSEEEDDEDDTHAASRHPVRPEPKDFTIEELVDSTDRFQACLFLYNVEKCMEGVCENYRGLKKNLQYLRDNDIDNPSRLLSYLMTNAASTNFSIRQVQLLEEELKLDLPHLSTVYRVVACVFLKNEVDKFDKYAKGRGKQVPRFELTALVGDIVEQAFRLPKGRWNVCVDEIVNDFCLKWSLPFKEVKNHGQVTFVFALCETRVDTIDAPRGLSDTFAAHSWMYNREFVGGDRSILNTQALLQRLAQWLPQETPARLLPADGCYGKVWNEQQYLAGKIQGDMDQLLMAEILPELLFSCQVGVLSLDIPKKDELLPLFKLLKDFVANPAKPVPMSLTFGIHAILTSIYEVQGDNDVTTIGAAAKKAYTTFFDQLDEQLDSEGSSYTLWLKELKKLKPFRELPKSLGQPSSNEAEDKAFWNPCCAGMFLVYLTYFVNVEHGAHVMDGLHQLRIVFHIYNALQQRELIAGNVPLLTALDKYFEGVQSIWEGEKPTRSGILKKFWISIGMRADVLRRLHDECRRFVYAKTVSSKEEVLHTRDGTYTRKLTKCDPGEFSKAYRMICLRDFRGMADGHDLPEEVDKDAAAWNESFVLLQNHMVQTMADEDKLVSWNLLAVGGCVDGFIHFIVDQLGWREWLDHVAADCSDSSVENTTRTLRAAICRRVANFILGPLEFVDSVEIDPLIVTVRDCLVEYFFTLNSSKYTLFNTMDDDDTNDDDSDDNTDDDSEL